jgi:hypothetical protein
MRVNSIIFEVFFNRQTTNCTITVKYIAQHGIDN